eukprot:2058152-Prymnesium_polylepis.2
MAFLRDDVAALRMRAWKATNAPRASRFEETARRSRSVRTRAGMWGALGSSDQSVALDQPLR